MLVNQLANRDVTTYTPAPALIHSSCATKSRNRSSNSYNQPINVSVIESPGTSADLLAKIEARESKIETMSIVPNPPVAFIPVASHLLSQRWRNLTLCNKTFPTTNKDTPTTGQEAIRIAKGTTILMTEEEQISTSVVDTYNAPSGNFQVGGTSQVNNSYQASTSSNNQAGGAVQINAPPGFTAKQATSNITYGSSFEDEMRKHMKFVTEKLTNHESVLQGQHANQQRMEAQIAEIMQKLEQRPLRHFPSN
ncbi:hypothetical protein LINGRAHAP2_LOCUS14159 [Linum grandiflorum]